MKLMHGKLVLQAILVVLVLAFVASLASAQRCDQWILAEPVYDPNCRLVSIDAHHLSYQNCGAPHPNQLVVRLYRDVSSMDGGTTFLQLGLRCFTNGCGTSTPQNCGVPAVVRLNFSIPASWAGSLALIELWRGQTNFLGMQFCRSAGAVPIDLPQWRVVIHSPPQQILGPNIGVTLVGLGTPNPNASVFLTGAPPNTAVALYWAHSRCSWIPLSVGSFGLCGPSHLFRVLTTGPLGGADVSNIKIPSLLAGQTLFVQWFWLEPSGKPGASTVAEILLGC